jgi:radical SAM superfamily enzyme YgiQ (UPF0313 family)
MVSNKKLKLMLINPGKEEKWSVSEPLQLLYLATFIEKKGFKVKISDEQVGDDVFSDMQSFSPDYIGLTATTPLANRAYEILKKIKENHQTTTIIGGVHATVMPNEAKKYADIVIVGEGEEALLQILKKKIKKGIIERGIKKDIDAYPFPQRHFIDQDFYSRAKDRLGNVVSHLYFLPNKTKVATVLTSRGCPRRCIFCHNSWRFTPLRSHSSQRVVQELSYLIKEYGIKAIFFMDDNFLVNKKRIKEICQLIKSKNLNFTWGCNASAHFVDEEILSEIKNAGCREIVFGFESGSQKILDLLGKGTSVKMNEKALRLCKKYNFDVTASFMVGNPQETAKDIKLTQKFIKDNLDYIDMYGVNITTPYPGTKLWEDCVKSKKIDKNIDWGMFSQDNTNLICSDLPKDKLEELYLETFAIQKLSFSRMVSKLFSNLPNYLSLISRHPLKSVKIFVKILTKV